MLTLAALSLILAQPQPVTVALTADNTRIDKSCILTIAPGAVLPDSDNNGVIQVGADDITIEFAPASVLSGAKPDQAPDTFSGIGIRLDGHTGVTIKNAHVSGYRVGLFASACPKLTIEGGDFSNNYHQHLKSTPLAEDGADWLFPHNNDEDQWMKQHGAGLCIKSADNVTIRNILIRRGQNGIILDRVTDSRVYDNDCSFLSGWGLAMWRSSRNLVSRNAFDFCVRGYSHNVYNRGQDSAGILIFEQCNQNAFIENSVTHGGDGIFGFAGREAIGEVPAPKTDDGAPFDYKRRGDSDNLFVRNDLSYAPAHGLEMTFSHGNYIVQNRFVENAICGIWGGYSCGTTIAENTFDSNGQMAYGLERGGINIEHGSDNFIAGNTFKDNKCGVHLWWDDDGNLLKMAGVAANYKGVTGNLIADNSFTGDAIGLQLRDASPDKSKVRGTTFLNNKLTNVAKETDLTPGLSLTTTGDSPMYAIPNYAAMGEKRPVGARPNLRGRQNIVMTEWGPWDHQSPLARLVDISGGRHTYEFTGIEPANVSVSGIGINSDIQGGSASKPWKMSVGSPAPGAHSYTLKIDQPGYAQELRGNLLDITWNLTVFPWESLPGPNPPPDLAKWRESANGPKAVRAKTDKLSFPFGGRGPSDVNISPEVTAAKFKGDYFGIIATAKLPLTKGKWKITTKSDDGIHVIADGKLLIDNWTHHGATDDSATLDLSADQTIDLTVEYFEIFGGAVLEFSIERLP